MKGVVKLHGKIRKALKGPPSGKKKLESKKCRYCGEEFKLGESLKLHRLSSHH